MDAGFFYVVAFSHTVTDLLLLGSLAVSDRAGGFGSGWWVLQYIYSR